MLNSRNTLVLEENTNFADGMEFSVGKWQM